MKHLLALILIAVAITAQAQTTMICQSMSGQQFVWVGTQCPAGSIFISY